VDRISLALVVFDELPGRGPLQEKAFHIGSEAGDRWDRVIFDRSSGKLYYDPDGTGAANQVALAYLGDIALTHSAFVIY
jgi:serralysin